MLMRVDQSLQRDFGAIAAKMDADWNNCNSAWIQGQSQASRAIRAEAGDPTLMNQYNIGESGNNINNFYFNRIRPICNMVWGYQIQNRKASIVVPLESGDQETADQWSKIILQVFKKENVYDVVSEAFHRGSCITGLNLVQIYLDYTNDPLNGDVKYDVLDMPEFFIDPFFKRRDLSDAQFIWRRTYMSPSAAAAICPPDMWESVMQFQGSPSGISKDGRFNYMPEAFGTTQANKFSYDEYWYRDYRKAKFIYDANTGDIKDVTDDLDTDFELALDENPQLSFHEKMIPTVNLAIRIQGVVIYNGRNSLNIDDYPFIPWFGYYSKSLPYFHQRIQGLVYSLIDPQILFNRRVLLNASMAESLLTTGYKFKEGSVIDIKTLFQTGAGRVIPIRDGYQMSDVEQLQASSIPNSYFQLSDIFDKELFNVVGISEESLGKVSGGDVSGYLAAQRTAAGMTSLQGLYDGCDISQNMLTDRTMDIIRANYTPPKIRRLLEGEEPAELFYDRAFGKYHSQTQMAFNTESQRQLQFAQLLMLRKDAQVQISDEDMIEASTIQHKEKLLERMQQAKEAQQQQAQQQAESQMQLQQAQSELARARSYADIGLFNERSSRVQENYALAEQKKAEAVQNENQALLNFVKSAKELEGIDLAHIRELLEMQGLIKAQEAENHLEERSTSKAPTPVDDAENAQKLIQGQPVGGSQQQQGAPQMQEKGQVPQDIKQLMQ